MTDPEPSYRVVCAWCDLVLVEGPQPTSHGICPACHKRERDALEQEGFTDEL